MAFVILLLPLIAAAAILLGARRSASASVIISVASAAICFVLSLVLIGGGEGDKGSFEWLSVGEFKLQIGLTLTSLAKGMIIVVTFIGLLVHIFSMGYMKDDEGKARFFAGLSLFMFSMTGIVLADNLAMMFIFWELVGVSSFLLIGHWFTKNSAAEASKKAFLVNRIGDFGFMIGILLIWGAFGTVNFGELKEALAAGSYDASLLNWAMVSIFCGAVGKSAQLPLHVWLPDAMEGPTPVSALIHAATMVAAGVFMLTKVSFLIAVAPQAALVIQYVGGGTALFAALLATQQADIKKILAYSTLSQLGYMVMAVGFVGAIYKDAPVGDVAAFSGFFHLYTHAFFKALLFLGSGAIIYACHHEQDIWKMGGLFGKMRITSITFLVGTAALAGIPLLSGFFSKDAVLALAWDNNLFLFGVGAFTALLTAFYMTRLCAVVFFGEARGDGAKHAKEVPPVMLVPLIVLAVGAVFAGYGFAFKWFLPEGADIAHPHHSGFAFYAILIILALVGIAIGFLLYRNKSEEPYRITPLENKFYIDEIYLGIVKVLQDGVAYVAKAVDQVLVDGLLVRGTARLTSGVGSLLRGLQVGNLQGYAFLFGLGVVVVLYIITTSLK